MRTHGHREGSITHWGLSGGTRGGTVGAGWGVAEPVVKSKPYKAAVAVSTVVIFGTLSMFLYPALHQIGRAHV